MHSSSVPRLGGRGGIPLGHVMDVNDPILHTTLSYMRGPGDSSGMQRHFRQYAGTPDQTFNRAPNAHVRPLTPGLTALSSSLRAPTSPSLHGNGSTPSWWGWPTPV